MSSRLEFTTDIVHIDLFVAVSRRMNEQWMFTWKRILKSSYVVLTKLFLIAKR